MKARKMYLEALRVISVFLVMWGHFVGTGTNALEIPGVINGGLPVQILPSSAHRLWQIDAFFYNYFHVQAANLGVLIFFVITGYVTAMQMDKYSRKAFLFNRVSRIYPTLIASVALVGILVFFLQGIVYPAKTYLLSMSLLFPWISGGATMGILWFLAVSFTFYIVMVLIGKPTKEKVIILYGVIFFSFVIAQKIAIWQFGNLANYLKFISVILIGVSFYLTTDMSNIRDKVLWMGGAVLLSFSAFRCYKQFFGDESTYPSIGSFVIVLGLFFGVYLMEKQFPQIFNKLSAPLSFFSEISYAFYLLHVSFGLLTMYYLRLWGGNVYLALFGGIIVSVVVAYFVHTLVEQPCARFLENFKIRMKTLDSTSISHTEDSPTDMVQHIVTVDQVSMMFNLSTERVDNLKEYFIRFLKRNLFFTEFWALKDISFSIDKQESLAIIGLNGSGKSTLLKLISGVLKPTEGKVMVLGRVAPLLELGAGFDMDLSARENIYLNGTVLGYSKKQIEEAFQSIVEFSELQDFLNVPLKNFSSGMLARLGFAIATDVQPDVLILDEVLSVGDYRFQEKCENRIMNMIQNGTTVIFVSHSTEQVKKICQKAVWLQNGRLKMYGDVDTVCEAYMN